MAILTLYRGCRSYAEKNNILNNKTARGYNPPNSQTTAPLEDEVRQYVAHCEGQVTEDLSERDEPNDKIPELVEYTTDFHIAKQYNRGGVILITIDKKYCTNGSGIENGYIIRKDAPLTTVEELIENKSETQEIPDSPLIPRD